MKYFIGLCVALGMAFIIFNQRMEGSSKPPSQEPVETPKSVALEPPPFSSIGKSEEEIVQKFGEPNSRLELGDETTLMYSHNSFRFENGIVIEIKPGTKSWEAAATQSTASTPQNSSYDLVKLQEELANKKESYQQLLKDCQRQEAQIRERCNREIGVLRRDASINGVRSVNSFYSNDRRKLESDRDAEISRLRASTLTPSQLEIQRLEKEISESTRRGQQTTS